MNQVVNFLSLLAVTEEQGGVKRMLGVCIEFERIAKVVLEKAEKESHSRRKRKNNKDSEESLQTPPPQTAQKRTAPITPASQTQQPPTNSFMPEFSGDLNSQPFNPTLNGFSPGLSNGDMAMPLDFSSMLNPPVNIPPKFSDSELQQVANNSNGSLNMGSFQQPFVPQDLWQMPMTLEWDWADISNMTYPDLSDQNLNGSS